MSDFIRGLLVSVDTLGTKTLLKRIKQLVPTPPPPKKSQNSSKMVHPPPPRGRESHRGRRSVQAREFSHPRVGRKPGLITEPPSFHSPETRLVTMQSGNRGKNPELEPNGNKLGLRLPLVTTGQGVSPASASVFSPAKWASEHRRSGRMT